MGRSRSQTTEFAEDAQLYVATAPCEAGVLMVASSRAGIAAVSLGAHANVLVRDLASICPWAEVSSHDPAEIAKRGLHAALAYLRSQGRALAPALDLRGTAWTQSVWQALVEVPFGEQQTYSGLAATLQLTHGARAVARACASNRIALIIPCHRIVRTDGALGGYRWGLTYKTALLEWERAMVGGAWLGGTPPPSLPLGLRAPALQPEPSRPSAGP